MPSERARVTAVLGALHAAEAAGAQALERWAAACRLPGLRGGLRAIAQRDLAHARLAHDRLVGLGGTVSVAPGRGLAALCQQLVSGERDDREKLALLVARLPRRDAGVPDALLHGVEIDAETHALLLEIGADDAASRDWLDGAATMATPDEGRPSPEALRAMDAWRAAEAAGAEVVAAWAIVTPAPALRGVLRAVAARESAHAALLAGRLRDLGADETAAVPADVRAAAIDWYGARAVPDADKLARAHERAGRALADLADLGAAVADDPETREMLALVAADERATAEALSRSVGAETIAFPLPGSGTPDW